MSEKRRVTVNLDYTLLFIVAFLVIFGLIVLYSTSSYNALIEEQNDKFYLNKQLFSTGVGLVGMLIMMSVRYDFWKSLSWVAIFVSTILLFLVLFFGTEINGAKRWLIIAGFSFQPAEFTKMAIILFLATHINKIGRKMKDPMQFLFVFAVSAVNGGMVWILTDNLSSGIIVGLIGVTILFVSFPDMRYMGCLAAAAIVFVSIYLFCVFHFVNVNDADLSFRTARILAWRDPSNPLFSSGTGYQTMQALYAIGSGGIFGKGLGNSIQKLGYIPEAQNDMIFTIICEEFGLVGGIGVLAVFMILIWRMVKIANEAPDMFSALMVVGVTAQIAWQVVLNVAVVTNVIPNTGVTLPFISYGGTSIILLLSEMGYVINISRVINNRKIKKAYEELAE